jgi:hypothetical protein
MPNIQNFPDSPGNPSIEEEATSSEERARPRKRVVWAGTGFEFIDEDSPQPLSLYFDLDEFSPDDVAEIIGLLSELYRDAGGDGLIIEDTTLLDPSYAVQEV